MPVVHAWVRNALRKSVPAPTGALALARCGVATLPRAHSPLRARPCARRYELEPELRVTPFAVNSVKSLRGAIMAIQQHKLVEYSTLLSACRAPRTGVGTTWVGLGVAMSTMVWANRDQPQVLVRRVPRVLGREPRHLAGMPRTAAAAPDLHPPASTGYQWSHPSTRNPTSAAAFWIDWPTAAPSAARPQDAVLRAVAEGAGLCAGDSDELVRSDEAMRAVKMSQRALLGHLRSARAFASRR